MVSFRILGLILLSLIESFAEATGRAILTFRLASFHCFVDQLDKSIITLLRGWYVRLFVSNLGQSGVHLSSLIEAELLLLPSPFPSKTVFFFKFDGPIVHFVDHSNSKNF